ncbi:hypothetical protein ACGTRS_31730 [Burkholderia semiarida]|uniref:Surface presentation of antigen domain-containing protein n=1 Tax=Burkholderia semiarida TaxID=2843303 RepID=A0ABW7LH29_9BURK
MVDVIGSNASFLSRIHPKDDVQDIDALADGDMDWEALDAETFEVLDNRLRHRMVAREGQMQDVAGDALQQFQREDRADLTRYAEKARSRESHPDVGRGADGGVPDDEPAARGDGGSGQSRVAPSPVRAASGDDGARVDAQPTGGSQGAPATARGVDDSYAKGATEDAPPGGLEGGADESRDLAQGKWMDGQRRAMWAADGVREPVGDTRSPDDGEVPMREVIFRFKSWGDGHSVRIRQDTRAGGGVVLIPSSGLVNERLAKHAPPMRKVVVKSAPVDDAEARS